MAKVLTSRKENYAQWYNDIVLKAEMAENSAVRGCMVIKPYGYAIWEKMQSELDKMFKATGHSNAYFHTKIIFQQGSEPCRRICQRMCSSDPLPANERP